MAAFTLKVEGFLERRQVPVGLFLVAGIAGLPLRAPVIHVCVKIMMAPGAVYFVLRMELVIEIDQGSLVLPNILMIQQEGIILGMSQWDESAKNQDNQQKF
jgi:hypothetical protein